MTCQMPGDGPGKESIHDPLTGRRNPFTIAYSITKYNKLTIHSQDSPELTNKSGSPANWPGAVSCSRTRVANYDSPVFVNYEFKLQVVFISSAGIMALFDQPKRQSMKQQTANSKQPSRRNPYLGLTTTDSQPTTVRLLLILAC